MTDRYPTDRFESEIAAMPLDVMVDEYGNADFTNIWLHLKLAARLESVQAEKPTPATRSTVLCPFLWNRWSNHVELRRGMNNLAQMIRTVPSGSTLPDGPFTVEDAKASLRNYATTLRHEMENLSEGELGQALVDAQDLVCLRDLLNSDRHWLRGVFRGPVDSLQEWAHGLPLDNETVKYIESFKRRFPVHEDHMILSVSSPISKGEYALMQRLLKDSMLPKATSELDCQL